MTDHGHIHRRKWKKIEEADAMWYSSHLMDPLPNIAIEFIPDPELGGFTAHVPNIPAYGEGETKEEAIEDLKEGIQLFIEVEGLQAALNLINSPSEIQHMNFGELVAHD